MSTPGTMTEPFVPLFRKGETVYGYFSGFPRPLYLSLRVGKRWSSVLTGALPAFSKSKRIYKLSTVFLTYGLVDGDLKVVSVIPMPSEQMYVTSNGLLEYLKNSWLVESQPRTVTGYQEFELYDDDVSIETTSVYLPKLPQLVYCTYFSSPSATRKLLLLSAQKSRSKVSFLVVPQTKKVDAFAVDFGRVHLSAGMSLNPKDFD